MLLNTLSRAVANRDYIDWRVVRWFAIGSVPAAVLGGVAFANAPASRVDASQCIDNEAAPPR